MSLRRKTVESALWSVLTAWTEQALAFIGVIVLARLLTPSDFGAVALAAVFVFIGQGLIQNTVNQALVQRDDLSSGHLSGTFWPMLIVTLVAAIFLILGAGAIAQIFGSPQLASLLPWLAPILPMTALYCIHDAWLMRRMQFRRLAVRSIASAAFSALLAVWMASDGWGPWSLVAQQLTYTACNMLGAWLLCPWRPSLRFTWKEAAEIFHFGKFIAANGLVGLVGERADVVVIGYVLGPMSVGLFNVGQRVLRVLQSGIAGALVRVLISSYSRLQITPDRQGWALCQSVRFSALIVFPLFIGLACVADEAVPVLLGGQWLLATEVVRFLALAGVMQSLGYFNMTMVVASGKPSWYFYTSLGFATLNVLVLMVSVHWGIDVVAMALCLAVTLREMVTIPLAQRVAHFRLQDYLSALLPASVGSVVMTFSLFIIRQSIEGTLPAAEALVLYICVGAVTYVATVFLVTPRTALHMLELVWELRRRGASAAVE